MTTRNRFIVWIATSVIFGALCIFPAIAVRYDSSFGFRGIEMQGTDAEYHYAARVREAQDGFTSISNVYYPGDKNQPYLQPPLPEIVIAAIGSLFGLDAARALILAQFLFGMIVSFVMIGFFYELTGRFFLSLIGVSTFLFVGFIFSDPFLLPALFTGRQEGLEFLTFARPINPQMSASLFFGALWGLTHWMRTKSRLSLSLFAVLCIASFYSYVYVWTLVGALSLIVVGYYVIRREWKRVMELAVAGVCIAIGGIPYVQNVLAAGQHPFYAETSMRFGLIDARRVTIGLWAVFLAPLAYFFFKSMPRHRWFVTLFATASIIALNQQLITGKAMVSSHYHWYFIKPFAAIILVILFLAWLMKQKFVSRLLPYRTAILSITIVALGFSGAMYQYRSYESAKPVWQELQHTSGVLSFLDSSTQSGKVIYSPGFVRDLIPVYTSADVFWATNAYAYLSSDERARDAYFFDLWIGGFSADNVESVFMNEKRAELSSRIHAIYYREISGAYKAIPDEEVRRHAEAYRIFTERPLEKILGTYPLNFFVVERGRVEKEGVIEIRKRSKVIYEDAYYQVLSLGVES